MVGVAESSMRIVGTLDTKSIDKGFKQVNSGFRDVKGRSASFNADLERMSSVAGSLATTLVGMGVAGASAMVGIASKSPMVAPALAKMDLSFTKLTHSLGRALAPAFEKMAGIFDKFVGWLGSNEGTINKVGTAFVDMGGKIATVLQPALDGVVSFADSHPTLFAGIATSLGAISILKWTGLLGLISSISSTAFHVGLNLIRSAEFMGALKFISSPAFIGPLGVLAATIGVLAVGFNALSKLPDQFKLNEYNELPLSEFGRGQLAVANQGTLAEYSSMYGGRTGSAGGGFGAEQTPMMGAGGAYFGPTGVEMANEFLNQITQQITFNLSQQDRRNNVLRGD